MKQEHAIALRQAHSEITRSLEQLERETGRMVQRVEIIEERMLGGAVSRHVRIEIGPAPAQNWVIL